MPATAGELERAWVRLAGALAPLDEGDVRQNCAALRRVGEYYDVRRLTPASQALTLRARTLPPAQARVLLDCAAALDPGAPEPWFARAGLDGRRGALPLALADLWRGARNLLRDGRLAASTAAGAALAALLAALGAFGVWSLLALRRVVPLLWHDLMEMAVSWRLGRNGVVVALLIAGLPVFLSGDVLWLGLWLLALGWPHLDRLHRTIGLAGLAVLAATPTVVELCVRQVSFPGDPLRRAALALQERRWDPRVGEELEGLVDVFADQPTFHRLRGDVLRAQGRLDAALWAYREGLRTYPTHPDLLLGQGTVQFLLGEYNGALESFQRARDAGADVVVSSFNLSLTLAHTYNFRESEEALRRATAADPGRLRALTHGREHTVILPTFTVADAAALLASKDRVLLVNRGLIPPPLVLERSLGHPITLASLLALVIAVVSALVLEKRGGMARACAKCGRSFCRRCRLSGDSQTYCPQCTNIFLKKDMVAIEVQLRKRRQLARRRVALEVERRLADLVLPGVGLLFQGRPWLGLLLAAAATAALAVGALWFPLFARPLALHAPLWPVVLPAGAVFVAALVAAQLTRVEVR